MFNILIYFLKFWIFVCVWEREVELHNVYMCQKIIVVLDT